MRFITKFVILALLIAGTGISTFAQDEEAEPNVMVLNCAQDEGCVQTESSLTQDEAEVLLGESGAEEGTTPYVVCADGLGCIWSLVTPEEADLIFGGDGLDELVFEEGEEIEIVFDEDGDDADDDVIEIIFDEDDIIELEELFCGDIADCEWVELTPPEIDSLFPEFDGVAYAIVPRSGNWQAQSYPPILSSGCPVGTSEALAGYTVTETGFVDVGDEFDISSFLVIPGATVGNPVPNVYTVVFSPDPTVYIRFIYRIVSDEYIQANALVTITIPNVLTCRATIDVDATFVG